MFAGGRLGSTGPVKERTSKAWQAKVSVEALTIAAVVQGGAPALRSLYSSGVSVQDFPIYEEEWTWIENRLGRRKVVNRRVFTETFPDFEWRMPRESLSDLASSLKEERAFDELNSIVQTLAEGVTKDNAVELAVDMRDKLTMLTRKHAPLDDIDLDEWITVAEEMRQGMILAKQGMTLGVLTGDPWLDHHLGGFLPGQFIEVLGRTGEGKSYKMVAFGWAAKKQAKNVGIFSPEQNAHETRCRYHTLASADPKVKLDLGIRHSFRNRALMQRQGFNPKAYQRFLEYMRAMPGSVHLLAGTGMKERMGVSYIEDRIVELELDLVLVDPIYLLKPVRIHREGNTWQETAWIAESLHVLSERYAVPIVFSNQAHEGDSIRAREDAPHKSGGFGSKALNHLSDYVLGVKHVSEERRLIMRCSKSRFGAAFRYEVYFDANTGVTKYDNAPDWNYYDEGLADAEAIENEILETANGNRATATNGKRPYDRRQHHRERGAEAK
jgi:DnaB-like helicase C terminal domain